MASNTRQWSPPQIIWSAITATAIWSAVGFSWFGHGFNWQTQGGAEAMSTNAVTESLATICVAQARGSEGAEAALKKFTELSSWKRREFVETAKWATMPGSDSAQSGVADRCAAKLLET